MNDGNLVKQVNALIANFSSFRSMKAIKKKEDIKKIPLVSREELASWKRADCPEPPVEVKRTSGFTGKSIFVFMSSAARKSFIARCTKVLWIAGLRKGDVIVNFSYPEPFAAFSESIIQSGLTLIPFGPLDSPAKENFAQEIIDIIKPKAIFAYPHQLCQLFGTREQTSVRICICGGEALLPGLRERIKKKNNIDIYDAYGSNEVNAIAVQEHPNDEYMKVLPGLHALVMDEKGVIAEEGEGEILLTDLCNFSEPIINYRVGDRVILKKKGKATYLRIIGRNDPFFLYNGEVCSKIDAIDCAFRVVQSMDFVIAIKKNALFRDEMTLYITSKDAGKARTLQGKFREKNLFPKVKIMEKLENVQQGRKTAQFIDLRNRK